MKDAYQVAFGVCLVLCAGLARAQSDTEPARLPQNHEYQKVLYKFMASVTEQDVTLGVTGIVSVVTDDFEPDDLYRNHIYAMMLQPLIGSKRGVPAVKAAPVCFTLPYIEVTKDISTTFTHPKTGPQIVTATPGIYRAWVWPEVLTSFIRWDYPGNPYFNNRALKLRAFMGAASAMMMFHDFAEKNDSKVPPPIRPDWHGYSPVFWAYPYPDFKDILPMDVQKAYETGLKLIGERMLSWGIHGETCEDDFIAPVGLLSIARAIGDPEFSKAVEDYARPLYTNPRYFHPAGYWDERGGIDTGFGGTANWFASWTALFADWPFVKDALDRVYRLRRHLILPEPDGTFTGPSHFNSRLGSPPNNDQWGWTGVRDASAAMVTDEAAQFVETISDGQLRNGPAARAAQFNGPLRENIRIDGHYLTDEEMLAYKVPAETHWKPRRWMSYNFPASVNPGYEHYRKGAWSRRRELEKAKSPLLKSPFLHDETFVRAFGNDFVVARQPAYAAIVHAGPVGIQTPGENKAQFAGPMGLGGGQLSAFWTPQSGAVILGLRSGMSYDKSFDVLDDWRTWPQHAVSGITTGGKIFTSARNARPETVSEVKGNAATVTVAGALTAMKLVKDPSAPDKEKARDQMYDDAFEGKLDYSRTFTVDAKGISIETMVTGDGKEPLAELVETIPVCLSSGQSQATNANVTVEFQVGGKWEAATDQYAEKVQAIRVTRFSGAVLVTFDKPCRAKLSPAQWTDGWLNRGATCRNVLIDLLDNGDQSAPLTGRKSVSYTIRPASRG